MANDFGVETAALPSGIEIAWESFGEGEPLLLIMGLGSQMLLWPEVFCQRLVQQGYRVIRFDNRDVGLSSFVEGPRVSVPKLLAAFAGVGRDAAPYRLSNMAEDAAGLLDALGIDSCHVVGASLGGMIAQQLTIDRPERVRSLCSIMSTTGSRKVGFPSPSALSVLLKPAEPTEQGLVDRFVEFFAAVGSPAYPVDEEALALLARACFARGIAGAGFGRQLMAVIASGSRTRALGGIRTPTLVIHGDCDPLVHVSGGAATAAAVPGATFWKVPGMGHDLPQALWPAFVDAIHVNAQRA